MHICIIYQYVHQYIYIYIYIYNIYYIYIYIYKQSLDICSNEKYNYKILIIIFYYTI